MELSILFLGLSILSFLIWIGLLGFRGQFWRSDQRLENQYLENQCLETQNNELESFPPVCAVVPARNEADLLPITLRSLLAQDYPGTFKIILVDDHSSDGTAEIAQEVARSLNQSAQLQVLLAQPLPEGWTGKLWALEQGTQQAKVLIPAPTYILLTDADIQHSPTSLRQLVRKAERENLDLASVMAFLRCQSIWEKLLIPAFVFFFEKLYPFPWVNNPNRPTAAAAGGCILIRQTALDRIGGIQSIREALIDDCALAQVVKATGQKQSSGRIWLGLSESVQSLRSYSSLSSIWGMVARTAFTQLRYSPLLLLGTLLGMVLVYLVAPAGTFLGFLTHSWVVAISGLAAWLLMTFAYLPTIRLYGQSDFLAFCLPAIAGLYMLMTLDSALRHWRGQGGTWKGRVYSERVGKVSQS